MVICLERSADLHMAQPMPLPLTVSCFSKIQIGFTFLVPAFPGIVPDKGPLNGCVCVSCCLQSGLTSLHVVSFMGYLSICLYLLQHGSCPNTTTVRGETALHLASRANQTDIIRVLLRNGSTVDARARVGQAAHSTRSFRLIYVTNSALHLSGVA